MQSIQGQAAGLRVDDWRERFTGGQLGVAEDVADGSTSSPRLGQLIQAVFGCASPKSILPTSATMRASSCWVNHVLKISWKSEWPNILIIIVASIPCCATIDAQNFRNE